MDIDEVKMLTQYYSNQVGGNYLVGNYYQRGYGIGGFLGGMMRGLMPILKSGFKMIAPHLLNSTSNILNDISGNNPTDFRTSVKNNGLDVLKNITSDVASRMRGGGGLAVRKRKRSVSRPKIKRKTKSKSSSVKKRQPKSKKRKTKSNFNFFE